MVITNSWSATQHIAATLCNPKVHYHIHMNPPQVTVLNQTNSIHTFLFYLRYIPLCLDFLVMSACLVQHSPWLDISNNIWQGVQMMQLLTTASDNTSFLFRSQIGDVPPRRYTRLYCVMPQCCLVAPCSGCQVAAANWDERKGIKEV
jgi:hypothetical protein